MLRYGVLDRGQGGIDPRGLEFAVIDTETTGLSPYAGDRVCEVALLRIRGDGTVLDSYATLVDPGCPITNTSLHGIGDADVAGAPGFARVADDLLARISGAVLVAHNLDFDARMLDAEFIRADRRLPDLTGLCTLVTSRAQLDLPAYRLTEVVRVLTGAPPDGVHRALDDARSCAVVLTELINRPPRPLRYRGPSGPPQSGLPQPGTSAMSSVGSPVVDLARSCLPTTVAEPAEESRPWHTAWRHVELDPDSCRGLFHTSGHGVPL